MMLSRRLLQVLRAQRLVSCFSSSSSSESDQFPRHRIYLGIIGSASLGAYFWHKNRLQPVSAASDDVVVSKKDDAVSVDRLREELPVLKLTEVARHNSMDTGVWVTYKEGVFDITDFIESHPGGDRILLAAGGALEPFWAFYAHHKTDLILEILEEMRIGILDPKEAATQVKDVTDPFAHDPARHPDLIPCYFTPFNAETPPALLSNNFHTPNDLFYIRNHLPVPKVDLDEYRLTVGEKEFKLEDLKRKLQPVTVTSVLQCAGNRQEEFNKINEANDGPQWMGRGFAQGAMGNAKWTGVRLREVLTAAGVTLEKAKHVHFQGLDKDMSEEHYETSIPIRKALEEEVILAYEMNGQPLPPDHGFPLRLIAPGLVGARQVKWVARIRVGEEESPSHWQRKDYRVFSPSEAAPAIQEMPVQSAICSPSPNDTISES